MYSPPFARAASATGWCGWLFCFGGSSSAPGGCFGEPFDGRICWTQYPCWSKACHQATHTDPLFVSVTIDGFPGVPPDGWVVVPSAFEAGHESRPSWNSLPAENAATGVVPSDSTVAARFPIPALWNDIEVLFAS